MSKGESKSNSPKMKKENGEHKMNIYCKAGKVELTEAEAFEIYESKKYIVTSYGIYQPEYHANQPEQRITFRKISDIHGIARRGRYHRLTGDEINHIMGKEIFRNL